MTRTSTTSRLAGGRGSPPALSAGRRRLTCETVRDSSGGALAPPARAGSSRAGAVELDRVLQEHPAARARVRLLPAFVIPRFRHGDRPPGPQPQEPPQLRPAGRVASVVYCPPVLRQERLPLAIGERGEDLAGVERVLMLRRIDRQGGHDRHANARPRPGSGTKSLGHVSGLLHALIGLPG